MPAPDIAVDLYSLAVPVLVMRWAAVFASVVGVGSVLPWGLKKLGSQPTPKQRQVFSLAAVALCLLSLPLLLDTYRVEGEDPLAFSEVACTPQNDRLACEDGSVVPLPSGTVQPTPGTLYRLSASRADVYFHPIPTR